MGTESPNLFRAIPFLVTSGCALAEQERKPNNDGVTSRDSTCEDSKGSPGKQLVTEEA